MMPAGSGTAPLLLDVALTPAFVSPDLARRARTVYIVVDVVRATTTLAAIFGSGCRRVLVAPNIAAARAAASQKDGQEDSAHSSRRSLLGGEAGGVAPAGFDFGNSPREYAAADLAGRELIYATTNGTRALRACAGSFATFAGSFRNSSAVSAAALAASQRMSQQRVPETTANEEIAAAGAGFAHEASEATVSQGGEGNEIVVVCAGRLSQPAYDDTLCAGYLVARLRDLAAAHGLATDLTEGARIATAVWRDQLAQPRELRAALAESDAGQAARSVGLAADLDWCAAIDASAVVPYVADIDAERDLLEVLPLGVPATTVED